MPKHIWSVLCRKGILDRYSNQVTIFNVLEEMTIQPDAVFPATVPLDWSIVTLWVREHLKRPEQTLTRTIYLGPKGREIGRGEQKIDLGKHERSRSFANQDHLTIAGFGTHKFLIDYKTKSGHWKRATEIPLYVKKGEGQPEQKGRNRRSKRQRKK